MTELTIISVIKNDPGLLELMIRSVLKFTDPAPRFVFCDNGQNADRIKKAMGTHTDYKIIDNSKTKMLGSLAHGDGLNKAFSEVKTKYMAIVESDVVILDYDWWKVDYCNMPFLLSEKALKPRWQYPLYHMCFGVYTSYILKENDGIIDFRPGRNGHRSNRSYKMWEDVGARVYKCIRGFNVERLEFVDCKTGDGQVFNYPCQSDEFWRNGKVICGHWGRGSNIQGKSNKSKYGTHEEQLKKWKETIEKILRK